MSENEIVASENMGAAMEALLIEGDLSKLTPEQRVQFYKKTCESLRLNYLTRPFGYIRLSGKLTFYAFKDCTEQLRQIYGVSIVDMKTQVSEGVFLVTVFARTKTGKTDISTGAVSIQGLKGEALANAFMKAETKAKRRATLSICGLGMLDETEADSIKDASRVDVNYETGEILEKITYAPKIEAITSQEEPYTIEKAIMEIGAATTLDVLRETFNKCQIAFRNNKNMMDIIVDAKNVKKTEIEATACLK